MKTTLVIPDPVVQRLREEATRGGKTQSEIVEAALRRYFQALESPPPPLPPLPTFDGGPLLIDVDDRDALMDLLDEDKGHLYR